MKVRVQTHTEWDPVQDLILGIATGAQVPTVKDESLHSVDYGAMSDEEFERICTGPYPQYMIDESNEDLDAFAQSLTRLGIRVHRPPVTDFTQMYATPDWKVDGYYAYCPRDSVLTVGNRAIETPMAMRHRQDEARIYRGIIDTVAAPRPRLLDSLYDRSILGKPTLRSDEPVFDAANCLKLGADILYLISNSGNEAGAVWLQEFLGPPYKVHPVRNVYAFVHVDSTIVPLRPGLVLLCPKRVNDANIPEYFRNWEKIYAPQPITTAFDPQWGPASEWIAMNLLSLRPDLVAVEKNQTNLMLLLAKYGIESLPVQLRHMRTMCGGPHCVALDLVRQGALESYR